MFWQYSLPSIQLEGADCDVGVIEVTSLTHSPPIWLHLWSYYGALKDVPVLQYIIVRACATPRNLFPESACV